MNEKVFNNIATEVLKKAIDKLMEEKADEVLLHHSPDQPNQIEEHVESVVADMKRQFNQISI